MSWVNYGFASRHLRVNIICQSDAVTRLTFSKDKVMSLDEYLEAGKLIPRTRHNFCLRGYGEHSKNRTRLETDGIKRRI